MNGSMAEAQNGIATLESVDESTMERFIDWANCGSYTPAELQKDPNVSQPPGSTAVETKELEWRWPVDIPTRPPYRVDMHRPDDERSSGGVTTTINASMEYNHSQLNGVDPPTKKNNKRKKPKTKKDLIEFLSSYHCEYLDEKVLPLYPQPWRRQQAHEDFTELFLSHARLHVFADMYAIQPLKVLTLEKLCHALAQFEVHPQRTGDIINLLRYVYANTLPEPIDTEFIREPDKGCPNHLRTMLMVYVASEMSVLIKDEQFKELLVQDGGPLLADFMKMMAYRIH